MIAARRKNAGLTGREAYKRTPPVTPNGLRNYIYALFGIELVRDHVCEGHCSQFDPFSYAFFNDPMLMLIHACRSGGKSMMDMFLIHLKCRFNKHFGAKIL